MAFGQKTPQEIIGMEPEELRAKLEKIDAFEARFGTLEEAQKTGTSAILAQLDALKPKTPPKESEPDPDVAFLANPSDAINNRLSPLQRQTTDNTIMLMARNAREAFPKDFDRWGQEIHQKMGELSADQQANPAVWKACVMMVRGEHAADLEKDGAQGKYNFLEPVSAGLRPDPKSADGLNENQRRMVNKLRHLGPKELTPEKYQSGVSRLVASRQARMGSMGRD